LKLASKTSILGPGLLLAATGLGGGDLATGSLVGSILGPAVLWAVILGVLMKYSVTEGIARWQLATGTTLLEGLKDKLGVIPIILFVPFLFVWTLFVGAAQMSACGITLYALLPYFTTPENGKLIFGVLSSIVGLLLVWFGGYGFFEKLMRFFIILMFVTVVVTAAFLWPGNKVVISGMFIPSIPQVDSAISWTVALIGGIGGTLTVLSYGYWMQEEGRFKKEDIGTCRTDLRFGYFVTAIFGMAMIIIGNSISVQGQGASLLVQLAQQLESVIGPIGMWLFLIGAWGAVFTSLLGVWQSVPYIFADCWRLIFSDRQKGGLVTRQINTSAWPYRSYLLLISLIPMYGLLIGFTQVQRLYTITGALIFPILAAVLLLFNSNSAYVGEALKNNYFQLTILLINLAFFGWMFIDIIN
jgi:Mn2+/Fe2+ NRAMP family transporter